MCVCIYIYTPYIWCKFTIFVGDFHFDLDVDVVKLCHDKI